MAKTPFPVEVLTPEGEVFNDEVEMVSTRTRTGSIGILANHQPLLGLLEPTELRLYKSESDVVSFAQGEGYVQVAGGRVLLLVEEAMDPDQLDRSDLEERVKRAEEECREAEEDSEAMRRAQRDKRRWERFLEIAAGGSYSGLGRPWRGRTLVRASSRRPVRWGECTDCRQWTPTTPRIRSTTSCWSARRSPSASSTRTCAGRG